MKKFIICLIVLASTSFAQSSQDLFYSRNKKSLKGVQVVKLVVSYTLPGTERLLPKADVKKLAEKRLKSRGLTILNQPLYQRYT